MNPKAMAMMGLAAAFLGGCRAPAAPSAKSKFTLEQLTARFYYDLGPDTIDVSGYPKEQQDRYQVFATVCSQCHTLARPINAPQATREEWDSFIKRMHQKTLVYGWWTEFGKADAGRVLDFLTYDSKVRKLDKKDEFDRRARVMTAFFADIQKERARLQQEDGRRSAHEPAPYVGAKP